jgi:hypothetical protein
MITMSGAVFMRRGVPYCRVAGRWYAHGMPGKPNPKNRPLHDKSLEELLAISAHLQEHAAALAEEMRTLVEDIREKRAVREDQRSRKNN